MNKLLHMWQRLTRYTESQDTCMQYVLFSDKLSCQPYLSICRALHRSK